MLVSALGAALEEAPAGAVEGTLAADERAEEDCTEAAAFDLEACSVDTDMEESGVEAHNEPFVAVAGVELEVLRLGL